MARISFPNNTEGSLDNNSWSMRSAPRSNSTERQRPTRTTRIVYTANLPIILRIHPSTVGLASRWLWQVTQSAWNMGIDFFASRHAHVAHQTIQRISILLLLGYHLLSQNSSYAILDEMKALPTVWHLSAGVAFSVFLVLMALCPRREAVMLVNFLLLTVIHCLLPLSIPICTGMFLLELLTWEGALQILALAWLAGKVCSYFVHLVLYRCL
jgi:hypothetical protein